MFIEADFRFCLNGNVEKFKLSFPDPVVISFCLCYPGSPIREGIVMSKVPVNFAFPAPEHTLLNHFQIQQHFTGLFDRYFSNWSYFDQFVISGPKFVNFIGSQCACAFRLI
jgi:hypothetical protein